MTGLSNRKFILRVIGLAYLGALPFVIAVYYHSLVFAPGNPSHGLRDITASLALWVVSGIVLFRFAHRRVDRSARQLAQISHRIADGDWEANIPLPVDPVLADVANSIGRALSRFEGRDRLRVERLQETRGLIRKLLGLVDAPVLVIGIHGANRLTLDYANQPTLEAFGESLESLEGAELDTVPGGGALRKLVEEMLADGSAYRNAALMAQSSLNPTHFADCAIVRSRLGMPSRLVVVMKKTTEQAWWRRFWQDKSASSE